MRIAQIELYQSSIRLKEPFIISLQALTHAEQLLVAIRTQEGAMGWGECSPFRSIHGETADTAFSVGQLLAHGLLNQDPLQAEACAARMDSIIWANNCIKSAFSMALYDLAAQQAQQPLWAFLGGTQNRPLYTDYTVSLAEAPKMAADALRIKEAGYPVVKVKLGGTLAEDVARIKAIREKIGPELPLRIDANQGWDFNTAAQALPALAPYNIQHCEEPIPRWAFMELPQLKAGSSIPLMADESCCDQHDAARLISLNACHSFNIKLSKAGGFYKALKIIRLAEEAHMPLQIGGFLESRLGFTAAAHLALSSPQVLFCDFDTPLMQTEDPVLGGIRYGPAGLVQVPDAPGLGAAPDPLFLKDKKQLIIR